MAQTKANSDVQIAQSSIHPKDAKQGRPNNVHMVQNIFLIWLDANIDENNKDCQNTITHLRHTVNTIETFTDGEECIQFLKSMADEKACMIISGSLGQQVVPRVHNLAQVDSIFIFCGNKKNHEEWTKEWSKIKGIFTEIEPICEALKQTVQQCEQNAISISIMGGGDGEVEKNRNRLDPSFMYTQIMKEILLTINFEATHVNEFTQHCREALAGNENQLKCLDLLIHEYHQHTPIWWYTCECFLYSMLNRALGTMNADVIIKMGFFVRDLHQQIEQLHQEQFCGGIHKQCFTVYRGQGMNQERFDKIVANKGGLLSFNNFLSTSRKRSIGLAYAESALEDTKRMGVLFVMKIDLAQSNTPFAYVKSVSSISKENEVLFSMHTVFRIGEITPLSDNSRLVEVQLNLASDKDNDLCELFAYIRKETFPDASGWYRLGLVLGKMGEFTKAQQVYETLLEQHTDVTAKAWLYSQLGVTKREQGQYIDATAYFEKSIEIEEKQVPRRDQHLAYSYNSIGLVYDSMGNYQKALSYYEKALAIRQQSLSPTHLDLADSYSSIGNVHNSAGSYSKALSSHDKALKIREQSLPPTHPDLADSYNSIGNVHNNAGDYSKALSCYEKALKIRAQSLLPTHPDLADSHSSIGNAHNSAGDYSKALSSHEKALEIRQQSLSPTHPDLARSFNNIGNVYFNIGNYPKALSSYEGALKIRERILPPTHPDLADSYSSIGNVHSSAGDYSKALSSHEKALEIRQQSLSPTHPDLARSYNDIGNVYSRMGNHPKALSSYEKALEIREQSLSPTHPDLADSYNNIGNLHCQMKNYTKALSFHQKALIIQQQSLSPTHPHLAMTYSNMGTIYENLGNYSKAQSCLQCAVDIGQLSLPESHPNLQMWKCSLARLKPSWFYE